MMTAEQMHNKCKKIVTENLTVFLKKKTHEADKIATEVIYADIVMNLYRRIMDELLAEVLEDENRTD